MCIRNIHNNYIPGIINGAAQAIICHNTHCPNFRRMDWMVCAHCPISVKEKSCTDIAEVGSGKFSRFDHVVSSCKALVPVSPREIVPITTAISLVFLKCFYSSYRQLLIFGRHPECK